MSSSSQFRGRTFHICSLHICSFADTRWDSFITAVHALAGDQTDAELARAREHLTALAEQGDDDALDALEEPDEIDSHWNAIYSFLEDVAKSQVTRRGVYIRSARMSGCKCNEVESASISSCAIAADGDVGATVDSSLGWLCNGVNFAAVHLLGKITASVPGVFKLIQGGPSWQAKFGAMDSASAKMSAASAVRDLMVTVQALGEPVTRAMYIDEVG